MPLDHEQLAALRTEFPPRRTALIGVSGGRDSMVLLHLLLANGYSRLVVCHFNHYLRGRASNADARFVETAAARLGCRFMAGSGDVRAEARAAGKSIETAARECRYAFFQEIARKTRCRTLFLAHHAGDKVETLLWNLLRGAAGRGLSSLRRITRMGDLAIVRPFVAVEPERLSAYAKMHAIRWREDSSNASLDATRNLLRHRIIPQLGTLLERNVTAPLLRCADILAEEDAYLESLPAVAACADSAELHTADLGALPLALQRRAVRRWLTAHRVPDAGMKEIERVLTLLTPGGPAKINLPAGRHARRTAGRIYIV